jgi:hypothetical protein
MGMPMTFSLMAATPWTCWKRPSSMEPISIEQRRWLGSLVLFGLLISGSWNGSLQAHEYGDTFLRNNYFCLSRSCSTAWFANGWGITRISCEALQLNNALRLRADGDCTGPPRTQHAATRTQRLVRKQLAQQMVATISGSAVPTRRLMLMATEPLSFLNS